MPHLTKINRHHVFYVHSATVSITIWRSAQVSRRRLLKKGEHLSKKREYVLVVSATAKKMSRRCQNGKVCKTCSMPHPTVLHDEIRISPKQSSEDQSRVFQAAEATSSCTSTCNATGVTDAITNSMIVLVLMYHQDNLKRQVVIYALLDPASNRTFVKESILEELQVNGVETQLKLNTMHGSEVVPTQTVSGLIVERMDREVHIKLLKMNSRNEIPSRRNKIPRPESAAKWPHLSHLANKICQYQNDLQVGLLIGSNCPSAIKPNQVIPGRSSNPYAIRTLLGWGIIGPVTGSTTTEVSDVLCQSCCEGDRQQRITFP